MEVINKKLLEILACPSCRSSLKILKQVQDDGKSELVCTDKGCQSKFALKEGVPILLPPDFKSLGGFTFKKAQIDFFNHWSSREQGKGKAKPRTAFERFFSAAVGEKKINYSEEAIKKLLVPLPKEALVLELGCGAGEHTAFAASLRGDLHLVALDISFTSVKETKARLFSDKRVRSEVSFVVADAENLPFKDCTFNAVLAVMFFHHLPRPNPTLKEISRTLNSKGQGLIVDIVADNPLVWGLRKLFPHLPLCLKQRLNGDYLDWQSNPPLVSPLKSGAIKRGVEKAHLKIKKEQRNDLFLFVLSPLGQIFPFLKILFPERFLTLLYNLEESLLRNSFCKKFSGAITLWIGRRS